MIANPRPPLSEIQDVDDLRGMLPDEIVAVVKRISAERDRWREPALAAGEGVLVGSLAEVVKLTADAEAVYARITQLENDWRAQRDRADALTAELQAERERHAPLRARIKALTDQHDADTANPPQADCPPGVTRGGRTVHHHAELRDVEGITGRASGAPGAAARRCTSSLSCAGAWRRWSLATATVRPAAGSGTLSRPSRAKGDISWSRSWTSRVGLLS
jgi:hypothetical protein